MSIEGQGNFFISYIFQVLYDLCFTRPRYQVSVYMAICPLGFSSVLVVEWQALGKIAAHSTDLMFSLYFN